MDFEETEMEEIANVTATYADAIAYLTNAMDELLKGVLEDDLGKDRPGAMLLVDMMTAAKCFDGAKKAVAFCYGKTVYEVSGDVEKAARKKKKITDDKVDDGEVEMEVRHGR